MCRTTVLYCILLHNLPTGKASFEQEGLRTGVKVVRDVRESLEADPASAHHTGRSARAAPPWRVYSSVPFNVKCKTMPACRNDQVRFRMPLTSTAPDHLGYSKAERHDFGDRRVPPPATRSRRLARGDFRLARQGGASGRPTWGVNGGQLEEHP